MLVALVPVGVTVNSGTIQTGVLLSKLDCD